MTRSAIFPRGRTGSSRGAGPSSGRKVQQCHPPASVGKVQKILDDFRSGASDVASFWINFKGRFVLIEYFALRDEKGVYLGTAEVSQDLTDKKKLEGEKRL